jgi:hypothetical protein
VEWDDEFYGNFQLDMRVLLLKHSEVNDDELQFGMEIFETATCEIKSKKFDEFDGGEKACKVKLMERFYMKAER